MKRNNARASSYEAAAGVFELQSVDLVSCVPPLSYRAMVISAVSRSRVQSLTFIRSLPTTC